MDKATTIFLALALIVSGAGAARIKESAEYKGNSGAMLKKTEETNDIMVPDKPSTYCASSRCDDYTDEDDKSKKQLKFRYPEKDLHADPMGRAEVTTVMGYNGYHHGKLKDCKPVPWIFSYTNEDWAMHMQTGMREGKWPNQPGKKDYRCTEACKLQVFNEEGKQINKGSEPEVWVERDGHSGDPFSKIGFIGWSPAKCVVGNKLQTHWWQQQFKYYKEGRSRQNLMVDTQGLPAFPFAHYFSDLEAVLKKEFTKTFCALTAEEKMSVTDRVRYSGALGDPKLPRGFPKECGDGWKAIDVEGAVMLEKSVADEDMMLPDGPSPFCASPRCDDYTDEDDKSKKQLKFRFPEKDLHADPMGRAEVATMKGYTGYHHGKLKDCKPVPWMFSYSRKDWATHMQTGMREGKWPNQPGKNDYRCTEACKLQTFNEQGEQLNNGNEPEVLVERDGHSGDLFSKVGFIGWSPAKCVVGNALQEHWWKQHIEYYYNGRKRHELMVDPKGLPVFPHAHWFSDVEAVLHKEFAKKFCALPKEDKMNVMERVSYLGAFGDRKLPRGFPRQCDDGWKASHPEGGVED